MEHLCTARRTNGEPCRKSAIKGGVVCPTHGGSAPQVKKAAADRLAEMVDPALSALLELLASNRDDVRLGAVKDILDRTGHKAKAEAKVEHTGPDGGPQKLQVEVVYTDASPAGA